jgi:hypothetical protein
LLSVIDQATKYIYAASTNQYNEMNNKFTVNNPTQKGIKYWVIFGILITIALSFPAAIILRLTYRFPFPFAGYGHGAEDILMTIPAVIFYGVLGGFIWLALGGAAAGALAWRSGNHQIKSTRLITIILSAIFAFLSAYLLAILDKIIGPW